MDKHDNICDVPLYRYRIGSVEFDEARFELHVAGMLVALERKPLLVFIELLRHANELVTRPQLVNAVWEGRLTVRQTLANAIVKLRKAVADPDGKLIVTVPRSGYKCIGLVERVAVGQRSLSEMAPVRGNAAMRSLSGYRCSNEIAPWAASHQEAQLSVPKDTKSTVFIVDDNLAILDSLRLLLRSVGRRVETFRSALEFLEGYRDDRPGCLILDMRLPGMSGLELQRKLIEKRSALPIIFLSGYVDVPLAVETIRAGAVDFILKPFRDQQLIDRINQALEVKHRYVERSPNIGDLRES